MFDIYTHFKAVAFANFVDIKPTTENSIKLSEMFKKYDFLPSTFQEISIDSRGPVVRLRLASPDNEWSIMIGSDRLSIEKQPIDIHGSNMGQINEFVVTATALLELLMNGYQKKANRIALISNGLLKEMNQSQLEAVYEKLAQPISIYHENKPIEWSIRSVSRVDYEIGDLKETLNLLTTISRVQGQMSGVNMISQFDRINLEVDINTIPQNTDSRFDISLAKLFYEKALGTYNKLLTDVTEVVYENP